MTLYLNVSGKHWVVLELFQFIVLGEVEACGAGSGWEARFQIATGSLMDSSKLRTGLLIPSALQLVLVCYKPQAACFFVPSVKSMTRPQFMITSSLSCTQFWHFKPIQEPPPILLSNHNFKEVVLGPSLASCPSLGHAQIILSAK